MKHIKFLPLILILIALTMLTSAHSFSEELTEYYLERVHSGHYTESEHVSFLNEYANTPSTQALSNFLEARLLLNDFNYEKAYEQLLLSLEHVDTHSNLRLYGEILYYLSEVEFYFHSSTSAIEHSLLLHDVATQLDDQRLLIESLFNLADAYAYNYDYEKAINLAEYGLALSESQGYPLGQSNYYSFLFNLHFYSGEDIKALEMVNSAYDLFPKSTPHSVVLNPELELQRIIATEKTFLKDPGTGVEDLKKLLQELPPHDFVSLYKVNFSLGHYYAQQDLELSNYYMKQALNDFRLASFIPDAVSDESMILKYLGYNYYVLEDYKQAAKFLYDSLALNNEISYGTDISTVITKLDDFKNEELNEQIASLQKRNEIKVERIKDARRITIILIISLFLISLAFFITFIEYHQKKKTEAILYKTSITDNLTQLFNRGHILNIFENTLSPEAAILILDIDNFKNINDTYGHTVGDDVLKEIASILKSTIREGDAVGRYGGEEFLIVFHEISQETLLTIAETIRKNIETMHWDYPDLKTTASIGVTTCFSNDTKEILHEADLKMYEAKNSGKNKVCS
jgi:diguanylate cyclase (GGDEF)-like protein